MGMNAEGMLFWGFPIVDEYGDPIEGLAWVDDDMDWAEHYATQSGLSKPQADYDRNNPEIVQQYQAYWEQERELTDALSVTIQSYGYEWTAQAVCIQASITKAEWSETKPIASLQVGETWKSDLLAFCEVMAIPWQEPKWYLTSRYG